VRGWIGGGGHESGRFRRGHGELDGEEGSSAWTRGVASAIPIGLSSRRLRPSFPCSLRPSFAHAPVRRLSLCPLRSARRGSFERSSRWTRDRCGERMRARSWKGPPRAVDSRTPSIAARSRTKGPLQVAVTGSACGQHLREVLAKKVLARTTGGNPSGRAGGSGWGATGQKRSERGRGCGGHCWCASPHETVLGRQSVKGSAPEERGCRAANRSMRSRRKAGSEAIGAPR
jgi:hypothetical protein